MNSPRILIVGNPESHHLGAHLMEAATSLHWEAHIHDSRTAWSRNLWVNRIFHHLLAKRPPHFTGFNIKLVQKCHSFRPDLLVVTGISPVSAESLNLIRSLGGKAVNYLTDDPWNPRNEARYFWDSLRKYDLIANPRQVNLQQLCDHGCSRVEYLPFGYNPAYHFIESDISQVERERFSCDVALLGGADADRVPLARALAQAGFGLALYGGYWGEVADLRPFYRGEAYGRDLRLAVGLAKVHVCMGRKANRDGHAMRSLEFPAMGACLAVEDSPEHRAIYENEDECAVYWSDASSLVSCVHSLINNADRNDKLRAALYHRICIVGEHTYANRLQSILRMLSDES
jgi:spore maturation protein CgeB